MKKDLTRTNWQFGTDNTFHADSINKKVYTNHANNRDASTEETRLNLMRDLRKSHLPQGQEKIPASTTKDSY